MSTGERLIEIMQPEDAQSKAHLHEAASNVIPGQIERVSEGISATSLFERQADTVVTIKGVTGTLQALASLCPRDLSEEPPEAVHNWTVDVLTKAGHELTEDDKTFVPPPAAKNDTMQNIQKKN